jgi:hypothetical protein
MPFREQLVWPAAGVAVIGGAAEVHFLDLETSATRLHLPLKTYFGHLSLQGADREEMLFVLECSDILAVRASLELAWHTKDVAVDGIVFRRIEESRLWVGVEMDPPGGWFDVEIDLATGAEISRRPAFTKDYEGVYRTLV